MEYQNSGMLSRDQLLYLFDRFAFLTSQPEVKKRIYDAVIDKQEAVAVTTAIQEEIYWEMGVDPQFGLACLGKVNMAYENDQDLMIRFYGFVAKYDSVSVTMIRKVNMAYENDRGLMIRFYGFVAKEEIACEEAELGPEKYPERMEMQQYLEEQQLEMLKHMRGFHLDDQAAVIEKIHEQMENANFQPEASLLPFEHIQDIARRRVSPVFQPL